MRSAEALPVVPPALLPIAALALALVSPSVAELLARGRTSMAATVAFGRVAAALPDVPEVS
jgi:hypothetical protein